MNKNYSLIIIAHPDDEVLWAGNIIENKSNVFVLCLTNRKNKRRARQFKRILRIYGIKGEILDFPDEPLTHYPRSLLEELENVLRRYINSENIAEVITHNPDGEYGHELHKLLSKLSKKIINDGSKLFYFDFQPKKNLFLSPKKKKALNVYFGKNIPSDFSFRLKNPINKLFNKFSNRYGQIIPNSKNHNFILVLGTINYLIKFFNKVLKKLNYTFQFHIEESNYNHCLLSMHSTYTSSDKYVSNNNPNNFIKVYLSNRVQYDKYPDRRYLVTEFLPTCDGQTLSVGCHAFNKNDCYCLKNPSNYETIDIYKKYEKYGSPYKHETIDFLNYNPPYKFTNIILYGVLGIPSNLYDGADNYTLYGNEDKTIQHIDQLLEVNGHAVLGPDIHMDKAFTRRQKIQKWGNITFTNKILKRKYKLKKKLICDANMILVVKKLSD